MIRPFHQKWKVKGIPQFYGHSVFVDHQTGASYKYEQWQFLPHSNTNDLRVTLGERKAGDTVTSAIPKEAMKNAMLYKTAPCSDAAD